jgi:hypothetical protein
METRHGNPALVFPISEAKKFRVNGQAYYMLL